MTPLASFSPEGMMALMIPIIALTIPIVAMLIKHQQQMAELIHGRQNQASELELAAMREELMQLKAQMNSMTLALDSVQSKQSNVTERLGQSQSQG